MSDLILRGEFVNEELEAAQRKIQSLSGDLVRAKEMLEASDRQLATAHKVLKILRKQIEPQYRSLQALFGELDVAGVSGDTTSNTASGDPRWNSWKSRVGTGAAEIIDLLLLHGQMNTKQLSAAMHRDPRTVAQYVYELNKASLIAKNGNNFSLKQL